MKPIQPEGSSGSNKDKPGVFIVMLPATGEVYLSTRLRMARRLAQKFGWSSIIMTAPYYGVRKPKSQTLFFIDSVKDVLLQSQAIVEESAALSLYLLKKKNKKGILDSKVYFSGFSYGGAMASCASTFALATGGDGRRLACASYVGSASPVCLVDGVLESSIDWSALKPKHDVNERQVETHAKLYKIFNETQLSGIPCDVITTNNNPLAVIKGFPCDMMPLFGRGMHSLSRPN